MVSWRKRKVWDWAKNEASRLEAILPKHVTEAAAATCRFQLRGLNSKGNEWGKGFTTFMQTFGRTPTGLVNAVQKRHHWIELNAHDSADVILGCFGLSVGDVYNYAGIPAEGESIELNLCDIVTACQPAAQAA